MIDRAGQNVDGDGFLVDEAGRHIEVTAVSDEQIRALRDEASVHGDSLRVTICDVALTEWPEIAEVGEHRAALEAMGIYPALASADEAARRECARVIAAEAQS